MLIENQKPFELPFEGLSMLPTLRPGDLLKVEPCPPEKLNAGDLVAYYEQSEINVHRLIKEKERVFLKGDAALDKISIQDVAFLLGKVSVIARGNKNFSPNRYKKYYLLTSKFYSKSYPKFFRLLYHLFNFYFIRKNLIHKK